jgi:hypothetical protein
LWQLTELNMKIMIKCTKPKKQATIEKKHESRACLTGIWWTGITSFLLTFKLVYEVDYAPSSLIASPTYCIPGRPQYYWHWCTHDAVHLAGFSGKTWWSSARKKEKNEKQKLFVFWWSTQFNTRDVSWTSYSIPC